MAPKSYRWRPSCSYVAYRLYHDFLMPSRLRDFNELLELLTAKSYVFMTLRDFASHVSSPGISPGERIALLRHDVDSDVNTARAMFALERKLGIHSSYYFRLSTLDVPFMRELEAEGSEAGYHYEEIATFAKSMGIRKREGILIRMREVQQVFQVNLLQLRALTELPIRTVASHGDFANRVLQMTNAELLDANLRTNNSIEAEAYDDKLYTRCNLRVSDAPPPLWWKPFDPQSQIRSGAEIVHLLVHPSHWRAAPLVNASLLCQRCMEGITYWTKARYLSPYA
jgi:hypothetical protein